MVPIPTEADEEARRAYREQEHVTGASGDGPDRLGDLPTAAEMMYLLRRRILGRNFFLRPDCVHHVPEAVCAITSGASERPMRRSSGSTVTMASYPGERAQAKLDAR
jgi:hypothetical protein